KKNDRAAPPPVALVRKGPPGRPDAACPGAFLKLSVSGTGPGRDQVGGGGALKKPKLTFVTCCPLASETMSKVGVVAFRPRSGDEVRSTVTAYVEKLPSPDPRLSNE